VKRRVPFFLLLTTAFTAGSIACTITSNVGDLAARGAEADGTGSDGDGGPETTIGDRPTSPEAEAEAEAEAASPTIDAGCGVTFAQEGSFLDIKVKQGGRPQHFGGTVVPGTYVLTSMVVFYPGTTGTARIRETLQLRGGPDNGAIVRLTETEQASGSFVNAPLHGERSLFRATNGPGFFTTPACPTEDFQTTGAITVSGTTLVLLDDLTGTDRTYTRLR